MATKISTFNAFKNRNYALYFSGQSLSLIGTWMQRTGVSWVVYSMTHSAFMLGLTVFASQFPSFVFSLFGGILSDRYNRYRIMLVTQVASMVQALTLAILTFTGYHTVSLLLILSAILGIINAFDMPARQPLVHEMINDKADLPNALALNSSMVNLARLVGPAMSGIVLQNWGAGTCFLLNALSFICVIASLTLMKLPPYKAPAEKKKAVAEIREGVVYIKNTSSIVSVLLMITVVSLLVLPYDTLLPVFAKTIFMGDASTFGYISSFIGLGAISCTLFLASLKKGADLKFILLVNTVILGVGLIVFSRIAYFPLAMVFAALTGFGAMSQTTICLTILQINTASHMRGRVMSFMAMAFFGMLPLGSLIVGSVSHHLGAQDTLLCQGITAILIAVMFSGFLRKDRLEKKDILELEEAENEVVKHI